MLYIYIIKQLKTNDMGTLLEKLLNAKPEHGTNTVEICLDSGETIDVRELMEANTAGFVYHSRLTDIDFDEPVDDNNPDTGYTVKYMDIYYFSIDKSDIHKDQMNF